MRSSPTRSFATCTSFSCACSPERRISIGKWSSATCCAARRRCRYGGAEIRLRARDGYCIQPFEVHEFRTEARDAVILAVQISPRIFDGFLSDPPALRYGGGAELRRAIGDAEMERRLFAMCLSLARNYLVRPRGYEYDCFALTAAILALLDRAPSRRAPVAGGVAGHPPAQRALRRHHGLHRRKLPPQAAARRDRPARGPGPCPIFRIFSRIRWACPFRNT